MKVTHLMLADYHRNDIECSFVDYWGRHEIGELQPFIGIFKRTYKIVDHWLARVVNLKMNARCIES